MDNFISDYSFSDGSFNDASLIDAFLNDASFNDVSCNDSSFDYSIFSAEPMGMDNFHLGCEIDFTAFNVPGHEALDHPMAEVSDTNGNGLPDTNTFIDFTPNAQAMDWSNSSQYQHDPDLDPVFEYNLRDGLRAEMQALDNVIETPQFNFTFTADSTPVFEPPTSKKKITKKPPGNKVSREHQGYNYQNSRITKPHARKPESITTPKPKREAKRLSPAPTDAAFTLFQEYRLQDEVLRFLGLPDSLQQFEEQYGHAPERLQQFIQSPEDQQRLLNENLTNPAFQKMLVRFSQVRRD
jgi:hypothetical protein